MLYYETFFFELPEITTRFRFYGQLKHHLHLSVKIVTKNRFDQATSITTAIFMTLLPVRCTIK